MTGGVAGQVLIGLISLIGLIGLIGLIELIRLIGLIRVIGLILTLFAFGRKISYICNSEGADRAGLPLIVGTFGPVLRKNGSSAFHKSTTSIKKSTYCILK